MAQKHASVTLIRLYTGEDEMSHFERVNVAFSSIPGAPDTVVQSEPWAAAKTYIVRAAPGFFLDWHNADVRRYVITISGRAEIELPGGQKFTGDPGEVLLAEDLTGKGHRFRVLGDIDWVALFMDLAE
jgi:quercetin dioxygenase-like cupin family protein